MRGEQRGIDGARAGADVHRRLITRGTQARNQNRQRARFIPTTCTRARHDNRHSFAPGIRHCRTLSLGIRGLPRFLLTGWHFGPRCADLVGDPAAVVAAGQERCQSVRASKYGFLNRLANPHRAVHWPGRRGLGVPWPERCGAGPAAGCLSPGRLISSHAGRQRRCNGGRRPPVTGGLQRGGCPHWVLVFSAV